MGAIIRLDHPHTRAYVAEPDDSPRGRVLVLHDALGLAPHVRFLCDDLADNGFVALAPDLFAAISDLGDSRPGRGVASRVEPLLAAARRGFDTLGHTTGPDAAIGFVIGATLGLDLARRHVVDAVVMYERAPAGEGAAPTVPVLVHLCDPVDGDAISVAPGHGGTDGPPRGTDVTMHVYAGAAPGFANADADTFHLDAAELAWRRTIEFLMQHLRAG